MCISTAIVTVQYLHLHSYLYQSLCFFPKRMTLSYNFSVRAVMLFESFSSYHRKNRISTINRKLIYFFTMICYCIFLFTLIPGNTFFIIS